MGWAGDEKPAIVFRNAVARSRGKRVSEPHKKNGGNSVNSCCVFPHPLCRVSRTRFVLVTTLAAWRPSDPL